ncbi:MAG: hotdog domain-containing protein [Desulfuromonadaceae bacterium]|jgi:acyl-coenzyme A thioesterase PaaI-like protein
MIESGEQSNTHLAISPVLVGEPLALAEGRAVVQLQTCAEMVADERGLVHGGFTFGLADYAAMLCVNDPNVVLGAAETKFLAPVKLGETLVAEAELLEAKGKKRLVKCVVKTSGPVFEGVFTCFALEKHIFDM